MVIIKEDVANGTDLKMSIEAEDKDEGENARVAYRISDDESNDSTYQISHILIRESQIQYDECLLNFLRIHVQSHLP